MNQTEDIPITTHTAAPPKAEAPAPHHISAGKIILVVVLLALIVGAVGLAGYLPRKAREEAANAAAREEKVDLPAVTVAQVRVAPKDTEVTLPGDTSALTETSIYARAAGYVRKRYVDIGDHVREGQLMAEIDAPELDDQVAQARAAVAQAQQQIAQARASVVQAQSQRDLAKITAQRYNNLVTKGAVARQDADTQQSLYTTSDALVAAQEASLNASEENLKQAQSNLDRVTALQAFKTVKAPFNGIVTARNIDAGALISASGAGQGTSPMSMTGIASANGNEMFRVAQIGTMRILVSVPQTNAPGIHIGMPTELSVNEFPGRKFNGKVTRTTSSLDPGSRTLLVEVQVPNGDGKLLPGMYTEVHFRSHRDTPPMLVPGDALISTNSGLQIAVLTPAENGARKVHMQPLTIGRDYGTETEVITGLQGDETVVVNPGDEVREGALVRADSTGASRKGAAKQ
jgi:multidrug efflux pump subunit AcrA (membrane-fusion protein)